MYSLKLKLEFIAYKIIKIILVIYSSLRKSLIVIGPVYSTSGGVVNHIKMIHKHTKIRTRIFLPIWIINLKNIIKINPSSFLQQKILKSKIIHTHVDDKFINYSYDAQKKGIKWVHTYHTLYFEDQWEGGLQEWQKNINDALINIAKYADIKISVSRWLQKLLQDKYNIETIYIPNGVNVEECKKANPDDFFEQYNFFNFVLFSGNLSEVKDPLMFINLAFKNPDFLFVMIGGGLEKEKIEKKYKIQLPENIKALGGLPRKDALNAVSACKIMVCTSKSEGLPTAIMEAMIMEKVIIAPNSFGCKEVLNNGNCGFLYDPFNLTDLNNKFNIAINNNDIGKKVKEFAEKNYDWSNIASKIDQQYITLLK